MKKILSIIGILAIVSTSTSSIVSCQKNEHKDENKILMQKINEFLKNNDMLTSQTNRWPQLAIDPLNTNLNEMNNNVFIWSKIEPLFQDLKIELSDNQYDLFRSYCIANYVHSYFNVDAEYTAWLLLDGKKSISWNFENYVKKDNRTTWPWGLRIDISPSKECIDKGFFLNEFSLWVLKIDKN